MKLESKEQQALKGPRYMLENINISKLNISKHIFEFVTGHYGK